MQDALQLDVTGVKQTNSCGNSILERGNGKCKTLVVVTSLAPGDSKEVCGEPGVWSRVRGEDFRKESVGSEREPRVKTYRLLQI